jgi:quercetin dioxygenase-like cupin family protein
MAYQSSPRPVFDRPTAIPYAAVTRHLWGDEQSGEVDDWIYVSSGKIHQLVFGLEPGGAFRHSPEFRTVFGADEVLYVLEGRFGCANPQTGEVLVVKPGEAVFFRKDTWHHGFNLGTEPVRVLEFFAPPPSTGASGAYAKSRPYLETSRYCRDELIGGWPVTAAPRPTMRHLREADVLHRLEGARQQMLVSLYAATEHLTVGKARLLPGQKMDLHRHDGDEGLYVLSGVLNVQAPEAEGQTWFELNPRDGFYLPAGAPHRYCNLTGKPTEFLFGVAPDYGPAG